jgi:hypothetical protein
MAASSIGEDDQLRSPDDNTHLGRSIKAVWNITRQAAIRSYVWNFAKTRTALPALSQPASAPWSYKFQMPAANLRLIKIQNFSSRDHYEVEGRTILCNEPGPLYVQYMQDVPEVASWDALFVDAFAAFLGFKIADRITGDPARKQAAWSTYKTAIATAMKANAIESGKLAQDEQPSGWELARWGFASQNDRRDYYPGEGPQIIL